MVINHFQTKRKTNRSLNAEFTLISHKNGSTVKIITNGSPNVSQLMYRTNFNSGWSSYTINQVIELDNGEYIQFKNLDTCANGNGNFIQFVMTGRFKSAGTLSNKNHTNKTDRFRGLFKDCTSLITGPNIILREFKKIWGDPIDDFATDRGLSGCFENCTNLISVRKGSFFK